MNLVRLGHYFVPSISEADFAAGEDIKGSCRTALVVHVWSSETVNLAVWNGDGGQEVRHSVTVEPPAAGHDSFHFSVDCPWDR